MPRVIAYPLEDNFIDRLADQVIKEHKDLSRLAFVFGGRRPALFLKKALGQKLGRNFLAPAFFSMDEFVEFRLRQTENFSLISDLDAAYLVYTLIKEEYPSILKGRKSFALFLPWAQEILTFFDELDQEAVPEKALEDIEQAAKLGFDLPKSINLLIKHLTTLRAKYHQMLIEKQKYTRGLVYLRAGENAKPLDFDQIYFCNFLYLHKTEKDLLDPLLKGGQATIVCQGSQSDWPLLQTLAKDFRCQIEPVKSGKPAPKLSIQAGFDLHSQAGIARETLGGIKDKENTLIVLPDQESLIPVLSEISTLIGECNVSMGYPLKRSALYSLFAMIFKAQETRKGGKYYSRDYLKVLLHPLAKNFPLTSEEPVTRIIAHKIEESLLGIEENPLAGSLFIELSEIENIFPVKELHEYLFAAWEKPADFFGFAQEIERFIGKLLESRYLAAYPLNLTIIERLLEIKDELKAASFSREAFPREEMFKIFLEKLGAEKFSFSGSPLRGLQILGFLETRSLSFDNIIMLDVNETLLPSVRASEPLIPREVKLALGLGLLDKEEEIQRYQFTRLIASAKNVTLIYKEDQQNERSRFLEELVWRKEEEAGKLGAVEIARGRFALPSSTQKLAIPKTTEMVARLKDHVYSATSVNTYLRCPLQFYYKYVLHLKEKAKISEEPEGSDIGTFIHELLEKCFQKFIDRQPVIDQKFRLAFHKTFSADFDRFFLKRMKADAFLLKEVAAFRLEKFLDRERVRQVEKILGLERKFHGNVGDFKFQAKVDRIDKMHGGTTMILDYKTGADEPLPARNLEFELSRPAIKAAIRSFQLPLYLMLVGKELGAESLQAAVYNLRQAETKEFECDRDKLALCEKALRFILNEIVDPKVAFVADEDEARFCEYCEYGYLCR
ncbi:MAG: PD-(D/E)XK nuclease family protein [Candidatus Margulisbacteria bacterium]|nr:PD-(D/E)XK nuclease family protein [Candidatus Margulisiibacteriota bacterium]